MIAVFSLSVIAGVGLARKATISPTLWLLSLAPLLIFLRSKNLVCLMIVMILGAGIGLWRGSIYMQHVYELRNLAGQKVTIEATSTMDSIYSKRSQIEFNANHIQLIGDGGRKPLAGSFKISGFGVPMVYRGDRVRISGKLFPMRGSNQGRIAYAQIARTVGDSSLINGLTRKFDAGMQNALPEPQAYFGLGLLVGQRNTLPSAITASLTAVGLIHIIAVSGYNLTIIVRGIGRLRLGSKYQKLLFSLALITVFVLITGFSASIVRAAIVSVLSLWAWYYGRQIKPMVLIAAAAAVTGLWNPFYVWGDIGWYLSFLAFFGVLVISPIIAARFFKKQPKLLTLVVLETLSAELMTLPLILMTFSQLSIIALVANALVVPLVPLAMLLSAAAGAAGAIAPQIAGWFAWPARLLLTYILDLVHLLAGLPSVFIHRSISLEYMLIIYSVILAVVFIAWRKLPRTAKPMQRKAVQATP